MCTYVERVQTPHNDRAHWRGTVTPDMRCQHSVSELAQKPTRIVSLVFTSKPDTDKKPFECHS